MNACGVTAGLIVAQIDQRASMSYAQWVISSLGIFGISIPILGFAILAGACVVVAKSRSPAVIASYLVFVPIPLLLAIFAFVKGLVSGFAVVALADVELKQSEIAGGLSESGLLIMSGLMATIPPYLVIAVGLFVRALQAEHTAATRE